MSFFRRNPQVFVLVIICLVLGIGTFVAVLVGLISSGSTRVTGEPSGVVVMASRPAATIAVPSRAATGIAVVSRPAATIVTAEYVRAVQLSVGLGSGL